MKTIKIALVGLLLSALPVNAQYRTELRAYQVGVRVGDITCQAYADGIRNEKAYTVYLATALSDSEARDFGEIIENEQLLTLLARGVQYAMDTVEGCGFDKLMTVKGK